MEKYLADEELTEDEIKLGPPQGHARLQLRARALRLGVQEQGRAADARRGGRLPPEPARHPAGRGHGPQGREHRRAPGRRERAVRRAGVQDRRRPVRQAHLLPRLLRARSTRAPRSTTPPRTAGSGSAASCSCTPTSARTSTWPWPATSWPASASSRRPPATRCATGATRSCSSGWSSRSRSSTSPSSRRRRSTRTSWARPSTPCPRRTRPSASAPTRRPARPSSPAWASCTSRCSSTACCASSTSTPRSASRRWPTARRSPRRSKTVEYRHIKQTGGTGQFAVVKVDLEPTGPGGGYEFVDKITGGRIPREYIPAVDQGIQSALASGVLAGYPTVDVRATLVDGQYHDVDSSEMAFKIAGIHGLQEGGRDGQARPARADHVRRGRHARGLHGRRHGRPVQPPWPHRGHGGPRATRRSSGPRCRSPTCSGTLPTSVRAPRAAPRTRCSSTRTSRSRRPSPPRSSSGSEASDRVSAG